MIKSGKGRAKFRIHPDTGVIYAAKPFEADAEYDLAVRAEDHGEPKKSSNVRVNVVVVPVPEQSEHPPVIKSEDQHVDVTESDRPGFFVALIQATDEDREQLWYDIVGKYCNYWSSPSFLANGQYNITVIFCFSMGSLHSFWGKCDGQVI